MTRPGFDELASALMELGGASLSPDLRLLRKAGTWEAWEAWGRAWGASGSCPL